jgi:hypothetical protein
MLSEIFKPFIKMLLIGIVLFMLLSFNWNASYYVNTFTVTINNKELYVYFHEKYKRGLIPLIFGAESGYNSSNNISPIVNEVKYNNKIILDISEYEVYEKKTNDRLKRKVNFGAEDYYVYKNIKNHKMRLIIKRQDKVLYDGDYIKDISKYVTEPGRYYFQTYVYRNDNFYTTITTRMSFNVILKGDNYE